MRGPFVVLLLTVVGTLQAQDRCAHAGRNALVGGAIGASLLVGASFTVPRSHEPPPRRISATRSLMVTWAGAWGAGIGAALALSPRRDCGQWSPAQRDAAGQCGSAVRAGALRGAASGGVTGFLMAPVLALPVLLAATSEKRANLDHIIGLFTASGVVLGAPLGAIKAGNECRRS